MDGNEDNKNDEKSGGERRGNQATDSNDAAAINPQSSYTTSDQTMLSELMTALATGARAVQNLPTGDDYEYQSSLPEFQRLIEDSQESLLETLLMTLEEGTFITSTFQSSNDSTSDDVHNGISSFQFDSLDDPLLWETCTDLCDALLEEAERSSSIQGSDSGRGYTKELEAARNQAQNSFGRLLNSIVDMEKPQDVYNFGPHARSGDQDNDKDRNDDDEETGQSYRRNDPTHVFVPPFLQKKFFYKQEYDPEGYKEPGHGLETKFGDLKASMRLPSDVIAPAYHIRHVYEEELQSLEYPEWELEVPSRKLKIEKDDNLVINATWVDSLDGLSDLKSKLESPNVREIAVDLEAHSYRSFSGMICLIQITLKDHDSGKTKDFLIDPFPIWNHIHDTLAPTFANPNIVKVFHGADSDIGWLQRDFGIFVVNMFDTGRAARALKLPSYGFAHVLAKYVDGAQADKTHQLSDWRQRPVPESMKEYAIMDTHYLLDIYHSMKYDLNKSKTTSIKEVLEESRKVCTIRFAPEAFRPDGYRSLLQRRGHRTELNEHQESALKELWHWRDQVARHFDESHAYVCTNTQLLRLAMACPTTLSALQSLLQPMPPLLIKNAKEVLSLIQRCLQSTQVQQAKNTVGSHSSAFFRPAVSTGVGSKDDDGEDAGRRPSPRALMSPVLGTEALYQQAGWISPAHGDPSHHNRNNTEGNNEGEEVEEIITTSATEDDADDEKDDDQAITNQLNSDKKKISRKSRKGPAVHEANQEYQSQQFTHHSLQLSGRASVEGVNRESGEIIDGYGPARAAHCSTDEMNEAVDLAKNSAAQIRAKQESRGIIGLISASADLDDDEVENEETGDDDQDDEKDKANVQEEFFIPRSMREIYRISNRNRRNKKSASPGPPEPNEQEREELAKAEAVLKARSAEGKNYIDVVPCSPKRQRTKSSGAASLSSSEDAVGHDSGTSREDDIALMQEIGWIESKDEIENMLKQGQQRDADDDDSSDDGGKRETPKPFDFSAVGPIGAFAPTPSTNPFFAGAAMTGGQLNQQSGKTEKKKSGGGARAGKPSRRQAERPEKREGRAQAYKKR